VRKLVNNAQRRTKEDIFGKLLDRFFLGKPSKNSLVHTGPRKPRSPDLTKKDSALALAAAAP
jgi:hypothetical protein